ncbi:MAG: hypothetical protein ABI873_09820 [Marmoricola sp.]
MSASYDVLPPPWQLPPGYQRHGSSPAEQWAAIVDLAAHAQDDLRHWPTLVEQLVALGRTDVPLARLVEGHLDALRIHDEAGTAPEPGAVYGVWASRSQATGISGRRDGAAWVLDGTLRFASGAGVLDRALVPVWLADGDHELLDLDVRAWKFDESQWATRAMEQSRSHQVELVDRRAEAVEVGAPGFYLGRPGFFPGGVGVAAVWAGCAARVADLLESAVPVEHRSPGKAIRLGQVRSDLATAAAVCRDAARRLPKLDPRDARTTATLARTGVASCVRRILADARTIAGAAGLAYDEDLTRAVDDLTLYVAQHNADGDAEWLGGLS